MSAANGRVEVVLVCGRCEGCQANAKCKRATAADLLPAPCCTWCGHHPPRRRLRGLPVREEDAVTAEERTELLLWLLVVALALGPLIGLAIVIP